MDGGGERAAEPGWGVDEGLISAPVHFFTAKSLLLEGARPPCALLDRTERSDAVRGRASLLRVVVAITLASCVSYGGDTPGIKGFPRAQVIPQAAEQLSFQVDGREVLRYHFGAGVPKPYFFPVLGPSGRAVTRIGHPRDPQSHRHHLSLWVGHQNVDGQNFWELSNKAGRIVHDSMLKFEDGDTAAAVLRSKWISAENAALLIDERTWTLVPRYERKGEYFLDLELTLTPVAQKAMIGKTNFGFLAVRVAKTMGVHDGGGQITNSEGKVNEPEVLWQRARWCDYSGQAAPDAIEGIALFDHPENPRHPAYFHVRNDGWMGASFARDEGMEITKEHPLRLKYRLWIHSKACDAAETERQWKQWAGTPVSAAQSQPEASK